MAYKHGENPSVEDVRGAPERVRPLQLRVRQAHLLEPQREAAVEAGGEPAHEPLRSVRAFEEDRDQDAEHGEEEARREELTPRDAAGCER